MTDEKEKIIKPGFEELFDTYYDRLYNYAYSLLLHREDAENIVSETFLAAYVSYDRYDPNIASPGTWLFRIAHNKAVDLVKSASYKRTEELPEDTDVQSHEDFTKDVETREEILYLYSRLSVEEREFLDMRYVMELKDAEVAEMYGVPVKTINKRYQRLLAKCRKILEDE